MLSRTARPALHRVVAVRSMSSESAAASSLVKLNFALPHETIYNGASVYSVICPGLEGEYGITANHVPYVGQLKPGVLQILHEENTAEPEKYFVAGGYALTHADSTTDVICPEAVKLDDIDSAAVSRQFEAAKTAFGAAAAGTIEQAEAQIEMDVNRAMGLAIGVNMS
jgi:F-type H+-transporting ATPase subunit delta